MRLRRTRGKPSEWFYCLEHHQVELGPDCPAKNRLGPYQTRGDAERAMETAQQRNEEWESDPRWRDGDEPPPRGRDTP